MRIARLLGPLLLLAACGGDEQPRLPSCVVDFPCGSRVHQCVDSTSYRQAITHDCHFTCGAQACSGATCDPVGPVLTCPEGTVCNNGLVRPDSDQPCVVPTPDAAVIDAFAGAIVLAQEGQACTLFETDDPRLICSPPLTCASTYILKSVSDAGDQRVYMCRQPCTRPDECARPGDTCCLAQLHPPPFSGGPFHACVPAALCLSSSDGGS
jgi:hypothetical protein